MDISMQLPHRTIIIRICSLSPTAVLYHWGPEHSSTTSLNSSSVELFDLFYTFQNSKPQVMRFSLIAYVELCCSSGYPIPVDSNFHLEVWNSDLVTFIEKINYLYNNKTVVKKWGIPWTLQMTMMTLTPSGDYLDGVAAQPDWVNPFSASTVH